MADYRDPKVTSTTPRRNRSMSWLGVVLAVVVIAVLVAWWWGGFGGYDAEVEAPVAGEAVPPATETVPPATE